MPGSTAHPHHSRLRWIIPAIIAALSAIVLFAGSLAANLIATDLYESLKPYRIWIWVVFIIALITAVALAVKQIGKQDNSSDAKNEPHSKIEPTTSATPPTFAVGEGEGGTFIVKLPSTANALHQLPPPPSDFTGRKKEFDELMAQIGWGGVNISGLHGLGGVGKTTLALKLAAELKSRYPDAQFYLDLKGVSSKPLTVAEALAHVVRAYHPTAKLPEGEAELHGLYISVLDGKRALLLMDNAAGREQVEPLIPPLGCVLLVTSRKHFTLPGVFTKNLDIMSPEESRELLLKIAPRIGNHAGEIAGLCGCLPFALRLAASALAERPDLSPQDYVRRLSDAPKRLKTLGEIEPSLGFSYDLLGADLQKLWRALAVFPAPFDARAAAAVWNTDGDAAQDALGELLKFSMVEWDDTTSRYHLHDLARLFADSCLGDEERSASKMFHAWQYLNVLKECSDIYLKGGEAIKSGLALFDAERRNIEAGQKWVCEQSSGNETAARLCDEYPVAGVHVLSLRQHPRDFTLWHEAGLAAARQLDDRAAEGNHLSNLGVAYADLGDVRRAIEFYEQYLTIVREMDNKRGEGTALGNLGNAYYLLGEAHRAVEFHEQALVLDREIGNRRGEGADLTNLGSAYYSLGDVRRAAQFYEQGLVIAREMGDRRTEGSVLGNLGVAYAALGETRRAVEFYKQQLGIVREIGDRSGEGNALYNTGLALNELGDRAQAIVHVEAALEIYEQIESPTAERARTALALWREEA